MKTKLTAKIEASGSEFKLTITKGSFFVEATSHKTLAAAEAHAAKRKAAL